MSTDQRTRVTVRPFRDDDYPRLVQIGNLVNPDSPESEREVRHADAAWDHTRYFRMRVAGEDRAGHVLGFGRLNHVPDEFHPHKYWLYVSVDPAFQRRGVGRALFDHLLAVARARGAVAVRAGVNRDTDAAAIAFLEHRGFVEVQRAWQSRLDVRAFDFGRFAGAEERVRDQGVTITALAEEMRREPDAVRRAYEVTSTCERDVPSVDEVTETPYEQFVAHVIEAPYSLPEAFFLAMDGDRYVGLSAMFLRTEQPDVLSQGLTGVLREYRGRGIALALKLRTARYALARGAVEIRTWNDVRNQPMLRINEALGFEKMPAGIGFERRL